MKPTLRRVYVIIKSERILFTPTSPQDLDTVLAMEQEEDNSRFVFNWPRQQHLDAMEDPSFLHLAIKGMDGSQLLGYMILYGIESQDKAIEFKRMVIGPKGKGYGREAVRLLKELAFEVLGCHRLWLDVFEDNAPAISLYYDEGFVKEGILRDCKWSPEGFRSMLVMSVLEHEFKS